MTRDQIVDFLLTHNGDLTSRLWQNACGRGGESTHILRWLDAIGVTEWRPVHGGRLRKRALRCPVRDAINIIRTHSYCPPPTEHKGRGIKIAEGSPNMVRVLDDPSGLFSPGATWPQNQLPGFNDDITDGDCEEGQYVAPDSELPLGIRLVWNGIIVENRIRRGLVVVGRL